MLSEKIKRMKSKISHVFILFKLLKTAINIIKNFSQYFKNTIAIGTL